ncbi:zinc ribbon domain-containing protein [Thermogemmatispora onikobensis]|uniref:zinc ribbon domain-containing protein n=1 Tax=Thermogemmatispora onikobensis TaxID=732234 RepID=UPI00159F11C3|nr:zinc ribbon domain-containing protein [Thermogemmatispora onikobensis]
MVAGNDTPPRPSRRRWPGAWWTGCPYRRCWSSNGCRCLLPQQEHIQGRTLRRRLALWQRGLIRRWAEQQAQGRGLRVVEVNPAYTSQTCSRCGQRGNRRRHAFTCPHCGFQEHADINAARTIRTRFPVLRGSGLPSTSPEARADEAAGKPLA